MLVRRLPQNFKVYEKYRLPIGRRYFCLFDRNDDGLFSPSGVETPEPASQTQAQSGFPHLVFLN